MDKDFNPIESLDHYSKVFKEKKKLGPVNRTLVNVVCWCFWLLVSMALLSLCVLTIVAAWRWILG